MLTEVFHWLNPKGGCSDERAEKDILRWLARETHDETRKEQSKK
jgi:hypothetical protein